MFTLLSFIWLWYVILAFLFLISFIFHPIRTLKKICLFLLIGTLIVALLF